MTRNMLFLCIVVGLVMVMAGPALGGTPTSPNVPKLNETTSGVYVVVKIPSPAPAKAKAKVKKVKTVKTSGTMVTLDKRIYVQVASNSVSVAVNAKTAKKVIRKIKNCGNNIYALAVNSGNVARATKVVRSGGRVYLRAPRRSGISEVKLASKK